MKVVQAARQLLAQVLTQRDGAVRYEVVGSADDDGRHTAIQFDQTTSEWLHPLLAQAHDNRIARLDLDDGRLVVTFASGPRSGVTQPFNLTGEEEPEGDEAASEDDAG